MLDFKWGIRSERWNNIKEVNKDIVENKYRKHTNSIGLL